MFVVFCNGFNGGGGACITERWRWNGSSENLRVQPRNMTYTETMDLVNQILHNPGEAQAAKEERKP